MTPPLSKYSETPYVNRFGSWRNALEEFVEFINKEEKNQLVQEKEIRQKQKVTKGKKINLHKTKRDINLRLRFLVMKQDNFKCKNCGRSPATDPTVVLHIDHIYPWSKGGETVLKNLQTLCSKCNLGKSNL